MVPPRIDARGVVLPTDGHSMVDDELQNLLVASTDAVSVLGGVLDLIEPVLRRNRKIVDANKVGFLGRNYPGIARICRAEPVFRCQAERALHQMRLWRDVEILEPAFYSDIQFQAAGRIVIERISQSDLLRSVTRRIGTRSP